MTIDPDRGTWKCYGCGIHGTAVNLVMAMHCVDFIAAKNILEGRDRLTVPAARKAARSSRRAVKRTPIMDADQATAVALLARERLWTTDGAADLHYLRERRGLGDRVIKALAFGSAPPVKRGAASSVTLRGVAVPWFDGGRLVLLKLRRPEGSPLAKYDELYRGRGEDRPILYPPKVRSGLPAVLTEGEFDTASFYQAGLGNLATIHTLGGKAEHPTPAAIERLAACLTWIVAGDNDSADARPDNNEWARAWGSACPTRAVHIHPPSRYKDWNECLCSMSLDDFRAFWARALEGVST
jgi:DNA primase